MAPAPPATCPNCGAVEPGEVFCEVCGFDFAAGTLPAAADPAPADPAPADPAPAGDAPAAPAGGWVAVVEADRAWFNTNQAEEPGESVSFPEGRAAVEVALSGNVVLIGRGSGSLESPPGIDLTDDPGASRRHATLVRQPDGGWAVVDAGSTNGTRVRGGLEPIAVGPAVLLDDGDHINVGAWTRITVRHAG